LLVIGTGIRGEKAVEKTQPQQQAFSGYIFRWLDAGRGQPCVGNKREGQAASLRERTAVTISFLAAPALGKKSPRQECQWIRMAGWERGDDGEAVSLGDQ
jgi:hypothetical protein